MGARVRTLRLLFSVYKNYLYKSKVLFFTLFLSCTAVVLVILLAYGGFAAAFLG